MIVAGLTQIPELNLDPREAKTLAASAQGVLDQYEVQMAKKTIAWMDLTANVAAIYGTRAYAYHLRKQNEAKRAGKGPVPINTPQPQQPQQNGA